MDYGGQYRQYSYNPYGVKGRGEYVKNQFEMTPKVSKTLLKIAQPPLKMFHIHQISLNPYTHTHKPKENQKHLILIT